MNTLRHSTALNLISIQKITLLPFYNMLINDDVNPHIIGLKKK